jgi:hypothetical protein
MPAWGEYLGDLGVASVLTYLRSSLNDSTVVSCNSDSTDVNGFAICQKTPRLPADIAADSVGVWEVKAVRDSLAALMSM